MPRRFEPRLAEKRWDKRMELELLEIWEREGYPRFDETDERSPVLVVDTPPPYPSGRWHIAAAAHYAQHDMVARFFRLMGYNVLIPFYADRNGLPVEVYVERKHHVNPHKMAETVEGRERFLELCRSELDKVEEELVNIWRRLGCSFEYWREGTDSPTYRALTQTTFIEMWRRGYVYMDRRPVNWCPRCQTALSEAEIEHAEEEGLLYYVRFRLSGTGEEVVVATTRPELLGACAAIAFNPEDARYERLRGRRVLVPLYEHEAPILAHPSVDPGFGTGLMMICSYGDWCDVRLFRELGLQPRVMVTRTGYIRDPVGVLPELTVQQAREHAVRLLKERGALVKVERIRHSVPRCWRCGTPVEIVEEEEYFVRQQDLKEELLRLVDLMEFYPEFHKEKLVAWITSISMDWPISRSRYYGTEIPVWRCRRCSSLLVPEPGRYYVPWRERPPWGSCPRCGAPAEELEGERKVFDTWFDSSISPLYVTGYGRDERRFERLFGNVLRPQGYDIIRTWLHFTLLHVYLVTGRPAFRWVRISGMGLDEKGEAMHKSKGNIIDPEPVVEQYGADAVRFWSAASAKVGYDYKFNPNLLRTGQLFATKVWNIGRFVSSFPYVGLSEAKLETLDKAMLSFLNDYARRYVEAFSKFDTQEPALLVYRLTWDVFASNYLEAVKHRAYNTDGAWTEEQQRAAWATLHFVLREVLKMLSPIMPFVTDAVWRRVYGGSVHRQRLAVPSPELDFGLSRLVEDLVEINSEVWKFKKGKGMRLGDPLPATLVIPESDEELVPYLRSLHKPKDVLVSPSPPQGALVLGRSSLLL